MTEPRLHLDANTSNVRVFEALLQRGHDVTRTPNAWMPLDALDEQQLLGATAQGRCIFTFNIRDFMPLAKRYPLHGGIILSPQRSFPDLLKALDNLMTSTQAEDWPGQVRWLSDWGK